MKRNNGCPCGHERWGYHLENGVLSKNVERSVHQLRQPPAWCVQVEIIDYHVPRNEINSVLITNVEPPYETWFVDLPTLLANRTIIYRGHGEQYAIPLRLWKRNQQPLVDAPKQIPLF